MNYVNQTEVEMRRMENKIFRVSDRMRVLEKLVRYKARIVLKQIGWFAGAGCGGLKSFNLGNGRA